MMMRTAFVLCLAALAAPPLFASSLSELPAGIVRVEVLTAVTAPRAAELTEKLQIAVRTDAERWLADVRQANTTERLAWDERLGLSRDEHAELQRLNGEVVLTKTGEAAVEFVHTNDNRILLRPDISLPELSGIVLDLNADAVETPFGRTTERMELTSLDWSGVQWKLETPGDLPSTGTTIKFTLGRATGDDRLILKYEAKQVAEDGMPRRVGCVVGVATR